MSTIYVRQMWMVEQFEAIVGIVTGITLRLAIRTTTCNNINNTSHRFTLHLTSIVFLFSQVSSIHPPYGTSKMS